MSRVTNTAAKLGGFAATCANCAPSCDTSRLVCTNTPDGKNYIYEVDSCGNAVTELKPLGTCSVDANGVPFPFDAAGNQIIEINEIDMDINSVVQNGSALVFTAEDGTTVTVDICAIVAANCNSPMVVNADGSVTYTDNAGTVTTIPAPIVTTFTLNADGSATYISEDGTVTTLPAPTVSALAVNGSVVTHTNGNGVAVPFDICAIVAANCNSPMTINADGSVTYVDNAGAVTVIPAPVASTMTDNGAGVFTHNNGAGDVVVIDVCAAVAANCSDSLVVNADGSVTHAAVDGTVQIIPAPVVSALAVAGSAVTHTAGDGTVVTFDICAIVAANCNSPMTLNPDGSVDYVDNAGVATTIPAPVNSSLVADVAAGTFTHTSGDGVDTVVDVCALAQICAPSLVPGPGINQYTFDNGYGVTQIIDVNEIDMDINSLTVAGSVVNFTAEDGTTGSFDICAIVAANCNSPMVLNADGSVSYTDNAGVVTVIPAPVSDSLVANADGSFTHTAVDGTVETIPAPATSTITDNPDNTFTHDDGAGNVATIGTGSVADNGDGTMTATDSEGNACTAPTSIPVRCDDSVFAKGDLFKPLTIEQNHAPAILTTAVGIEGASNDCAPPLPECPIEGSITVDERGITWQIIGGAYRAVAFTPSCNLERATVPQFNLNDAALQGFSNTSTVLETVCVECTNDDCVPWKVEGRLRGTVQSQFSPGVRVIASYIFNGAASTGIQFTDGTPTFTIDTRREDNGIQNESDGTAIIGFERSTLLLPGETARACFDVAIRMQNYAPTASNLLTYQTTVATMKCERCIGL